MFKLSKLIASSLFATLLAFALTVKAEEHPLIGVEYPPLPEGVEEMGGWSIEVPYVIDQISIDGQELLLLGRLIERDNQGKGLYLVVNVLLLPPINDEIEGISGGSLCFVNGKNDPNIIVIAKIEDTPHLTKARKAWRVEGEEIKEIDAAGLQFQCENFGYGL